jgi:hypothetical protein
MGAELGYNSNESRCLFNGMNRIRVSRVAVVVVVVCALGLMLAAGSLYVPFHSPHPDVREYARVVAAAQRYRADLLNRRQTVPDAVTLQDLVNRGVLAQTEVQGFTGMQVTFSLRTNGDPPEEALMRVRFPNGDECIAIGDGSVRQVRR